MDENILEFVDRMMEEGYSEELALRLWSMDHDPEYDADDYDG